MVVDGFNDSVDFTLSVWLGMEPPDGERVAVGSRDHSFVSGVKRTCEQKKPYQWQI